MLVNAGEHVLRGAAEGAGQVVDINCKGLVCFWLSHLG